MLDIRLSIKSCIVVWPRRSKRAFFFCYPSFKEDAKEKMRFRIHENLDMSGCIVNALYSWGRGGRDGTSARHEPLGPQQNPGNSPVRRMMLQCGHECWWLLQTAPHASVGEMWWICQQLLLGMLPFIVEGMDSSRSQKLQNTVILCCIYNTIQ